MLGTELLLPGFLSQTEHSFEVADVDLQTGDMLMDITHHSREVELVGQGTTLCA